METRRLHAFDIEPLTADFPYARSLIVLRSERTVKKTGLHSTEARYYLCSALPQAYESAQWLELIRGHWGGVEVRNHWRRDAVMGEDRSRSRNALLLANLALLRNALLVIVTEHLDGRSLPELRENLHSHPSRCHALLRQS